MTESMSYSSRLYASEIAALPPVPPILCPAIHPQTGLTKGIVAGDSKSAEAMRDAIVTVFRDPSRIGGIEVEIAGRLTALLGENAFQRRQGAWERW
ncbi:hypothetical protein MES5069_270154 [Mesorhizobium escarrei]|uniref:Uncharacterized protein n=1 Tax=Mesorhizobium escarrei TaxID=666018 RepID=A0ABM9DW15_9HYPH|nr:hypothetical protein MES5069_270154 [Mesorhizobium escarrei]